MRISLREAWRSPPSKGSRARARQGRARGPRHASRRRSAAPDRARYRRSRAAPRLLCALAQRAQRRVAAQIAASITTRHSTGAGDRRLHRRRDVAAPAFTQTARRPPNSGMVCASSTSRTARPRDLRLRAGPRERIVGSSTDALTMALTRSLTSPASGPNTSTIGRAGSGRARKASTSAALMATIELRAVKFRRRNTTPAGFGWLPRRPRWRGFRRRVARAAPRNAARYPDVVIDVGKGIVVNDDLAGRDLDQLVVRVDRGDLVLGAAAGHVDRDGQSRHPDVHHEPIGGRGGAGGAVEVVLQALRSATAIRDADWPFGAGIPESRSEQTCRERSSSPSKADCRRAARSSRPSGSPRRAQRRAEQAAAMLRRNHTTTLTIRSGTMITFLGVLPSSTLFTASSAKTALRFRRSRRSAPRSRRPAFCR